MNRADFMKELTELLADVSPAEREEAIQYYNDYFDDAGAENEQSVIASLGSPEQLARTIKTGLADGGNAGEFTEKGFSGYEQRNSNEVLDLNNPNGTGNGEGESQGGGQGGGWQQGAGQNGSGGWQQGAGQSGNSGWQQASSQNGSGGWQQGAGQSSSSGWQQGAGQSGSNGWQQNSGQGGGNGWSQNNSSQQYNGTNNYNGYSNSYEGNRNTSQPQEKKRMSGGMIALIVILCICASPLLLGIGGGLFGIIVGIFGALFGIVVGIGAAAISLMIVGVCLFVYGITMLFGTPFAGFTMIGVGMICAAVGLLFLWLTVIICGTLIPALVRGIVKLFNNIFQKGGAAA